MFNNLIESRSHRSEFKRRGSFFLFTTATYALLFVIAGVVSIYAYDVRLENQNTEIVTLLSPADFSTPRPRPINHNASAPRNTSRQAFDERRIAMALVDRPELPPTNISTAPNPNLPVRDGITTLIANRDVNAGMPGGPLGPGPGGLSQASASGPTIAEIEIPPPVPVQKQTPKLITKKVINSEAIFLPKPPYPPIAKLSHVQGTVSVQVLIDETGKVISAKAVSGNPLLMHEAVRAAYQARFSPTMLGDQPVKVSGVISYNFVLQ